MTQFIFDVGGTVYIKNQEGKTTRVEQLEWIFEEPNIFTIKNKETGETAVHKLSEQEVKWIKGE